METEPNPLALVTGANRGIGLALARALLERGHRVLLGSRDMEAGVAAARDLASDRVEAVKLDVADAADIAALARRLESGGPPLDLVVNNAGTTLDGFDADVARRTLDVNVRGAVAVTEAVLPFMRDGGAIVFVSSGMGELSRFAPAMRERFLAAGRDDLPGLLAAFERAAGQGTVERDGWPRNAYSVSKAAMNAWARVLGTELSPRAITVNAVCPGWVRTRMGGRSAPRPPEEAAESILATALDPARPTGGFFRDGRQIAF